MIVAIALRQPADLDDAAFQTQAETVLSALAGRVGYRRGSIGRAPDDDAAWLLLTEWESVGAYRRALGGFEVKLTMTPFMAYAVDQPSAFEELSGLGTDGTWRRSASDRAEGWPID